MSDRARLQPPKAATADAPGEFARLLEIMRVLRSPEGCPWDRAQSWKTLAPYVLEEAYEVVDAIERDAVDELRDEIGDLVFEGVFLSQVASDAGAFTMADALRAACEKLIRRHPHVFAPLDDIAGTTGDAITTPDAVKQQWDAIKARERDAAGTPRVSALDSLPTSAPALSRARDLGKRAAGVGFDWAQATDVLDKVEEELREVRSALSSDAADALAEECGDLLFALAQFARKAGLDPESCLRAANTKFSARFRALERQVSAAGQRMEDLSLDELEALWQRVKLAG
jgi:MazG family protein